MIVGDRRWRQQGQSLDTALGDVSVLRRENGESVTDHYFNQHTPYTRRRFVIPCMAAGKGPPQGDRQTGHNSFLCIRIPLFVIVVTVVVLGGFPLGSCRLQAKSRLELVQAARIGVKDTVEQRAEPGFRFQWFDWMTAGQTGIRTHTAQHGSLGVSLKRPNSVLLMGTCPHAPARSCSGCAHESKTADTPANRASRAKKLTVPAPTCRSSSRWLCRPVGAS